MIKPSDLVVLLCLTALLPVPNRALAQPHGKALDHEVYATWNHIVEQAISDNGEWAMFSSGPENGDAALRIKNLTTAADYVVPRGFSARFSKDSRFAAFMIKPQKESIRAAKREQKSEDEMPADSMGIITLSTGSIRRVARVASFQMPKAADGYIAYHLITPVAKAPGGETGGGRAKHQDGPSQEAKTEGTPLILRNLDTGTETGFENAVTYRFSQDGRHLVYTASSKDSTADGIFSVRVLDGTAKSILTGNGTYGNIAIDDAGTQVAFLSDRDTMASDQPAYALYLWRFDHPEAGMLVAPGSNGMPEDWWISEHGEVSFSERGNRLFFGTAPRPSVEDTSDVVLDEENVVVDIWSWRDQVFMPVQLHQLDEERKRSYRAVVHLDTGVVVQLANKAVPEIQVGTKGDAAVAVGNTSVPYRQQDSWDFPEYHDVYLIDVTTGERRRVLQKVQAKASLSPGSTYLSWWDKKDGAWYAMSTDENSPVNLSASIPVPVHDERHDRPFAPGPYGRAGWTTSDATLILYDQFDLWETDPTGRRPPRNITEGRGREDSIRFRYVRLDPEEQFLDPEAPLLLSAFHLRSRASGFFRDSMSGTHPPHALIMENRRFGTPKKARDADRLLYTRERYDEFPDLWVSASDFSSAGRLSHCNPQQDEYLWGSASLVSWVSADGTSLEGILYRPEHFDPRRTYPMIVNFYERSSDNLHRHWAPAPHRSIINYTFYTSRGYLVFVPDVAYKVGYPGESALHAVVPGVNALISEGFVDRDRIGIQGHSWGGYQIAYIITRTRLFRAAESGAPVANMTSAYGGIRLESGKSRMFQYERTQSRIGGSLWKHPMRFIENSPLFMADRIETPLLILHNDQDGAVPWQQGIELFSALRRLGKPVWLLNYNGEPHWPTKYQNKTDFARRLQQYFDHFLMDEPAPVWMENGVPAIMKGKTLGLEPAVSAE